MNTCRRMIAQLGLERVVVHKYSRSLQTRSLEPTEHPKADRHYLSRPHDALVVCSSSDTVGFDDLVEDFQSLKPEDLFFLSFRSSSLRTLAM